MGRFIQMGVFTAIALLAVVHCVVPASAQEVLRKYDGREKWGLARSNPAGDVDKDGVTDLVLGAWGGGFFFGGWVGLVSGATGETIVPPIHGPFEWNYGEVVTGVGDFDGDGVLDFASGVPNNGPNPNLTGEVHVWSGKDGSELAFIPAPPIWYDSAFGRVVAPIGDSDGDGYSEFAVGYGYESDVFIYEGPDAHVFRLHRSAGLGPIWGWGSPPAIDSLGDINGDGVAEYLIGWHNGDGSGSTQGIVYVVDGATGTEVHRLYADPPPDLPHLGASVAAMGDVDLDGYPDFAAGAPFGMTTNDCHGPDPDSGYCRIYSGKDFSVIRQIDGPRIFLWKYGCNFSNLDGGEDVNGDGIGDLLVGSFAADPQYDQDFGSNTSGTFGIYSGATGALLWLLRPGNFGCLPGDLDGDGLSEFVHGNPTESSVAYKAGRITIYRGAPGDAYRVCTATPNSTGNAARLDLEGPISIGNDKLHLVVEGAVPGETGYFVYGPDYVWLPFGDGVLCAGGGALGLHRIGGPVALDQDGSILQKVEMSTWPLGEGPAMWTPGSTWTVQFVYTDPGGATGINTSDAMQITATP